MSVAQRLGSHDVTKLMRWGAIASLCLTSSSTPYNLPLMLFGIVAHELTSTNPWKTFTLLLLPSFFFDFLAFLYADGAVPLFHLILIGLKVPIYFSARRVLSERGESLEFSYAGVVNGIGGARDMWNQRRAAGGGYQPMPMPGGFSSASPPPPSTSPHPAAAPSAPAPKFPSTGGNVLGSAEDDLAERGQGNGGYQG